MVSTFLGNLGTTVLRDPKRLKSVGSELPTGLLSGFGARAMRLWTISSSHFGSLQAMPSCGRRGTFGFHKMGGFSSLYEQLSASSSS